MIPFLSIYPLLSVLLRAATLVFEALTVGGVIFRLAIARDDVDRRLGDRLSRLLTWSSVLLAISQIAYLAANSTALVASTNLTWAEARGANFFVSGLIVIVGAGVGAAFARTRFANIVGPLSCLLILCGVVMTSHSAARVDHRLVLGMLTMAHHIASAAWIGGMPYLLLSLRGCEHEGVSVLILKRFSTVAMFSVGVLVGAGLLMCRLYIGSVGALAGTSYGAMVLSKVILTIVILAFGALNSRTVRAICSGASRQLLPLRRFAEAELGIGVTILLAAASLTSSPPAIDVRADRVSPSQIGNRLTPRWPQIHTPMPSELSPPTPLNGALPLSESFGIEAQAASSRLADIAWSEYNHHWAGLVVLAIGFLSLVSRRWSWARGWPLLFLGLAVFLLIRADAENWPLGPRGFWESFQVAEVSQHRFFVLLIVIFAIFEWYVQTSRARVGAAALVFPLVCAAGGALLLTHSHSFTNTKEEFLAELSHLPLGILAVVAGSSRWVEVRLPQVSPLWRWVWPICFVLIGAILLNYREA